ncbi:hypothetical protein BSR28_01720 [Boudabousia liubingyangii]|uniref:lipopolysaccharide biosynthesis protein n=1 Tax=Boudabousia liubingyangii TaxID=1921764 RepID=UPI000939EEE1|nr:lipopolysaccharide biosynthesis protein [Boudabousia liubingyangii]OKL48446.1 hypothetical protein BSR28_01720 [Boudabousia liubingyangii]
MKNFIRRLGERSPFLKHMLTLVTGTALAQIGSILLQPVLSRIYTPEVTGDLVVFSSLTAIITSVAALRYDMTIMLPKSDDEARQLKRLSTRSVIATSVIFTIISILVYPYVKGKYGDMAAFALLFGGASVFLMADSSVIQYWLNRKLNYKAIAINRAQQSLGIQLSQIALGLAGIKSVLGLLFGLLAGQLGAWLNIQRKVPDSKIPPTPTTPSIKSLAWRYKKMPLLNGPNTLVDAIRFNGIILLLTFTFGRAMGGEFSKAWALSEAPVALINGAISQVFFQRLATVERGQMTPLVKYSIKRAFLIGIIPFTIFYFAAPPLLTWFLGPGWENAGYYAQALTPWLYLQLATSPISYIFIVTEQQQLLLAFAVLYAIGPLTFLWLTPFGALQTIQILSFIMAGMLTLMLILSVNTAKYYDRQPVPQATLTAEEIETEVEAEKLEDEVINVDAAEMLGFEDQPHENGKPEEGEE